MGCVVSLVEARGDEPTSAKADARVVEGTVVTADREPVEGARIFLSPTLVGVDFVEDATATTDARGRYRVDLGRFPWSREKLRVMVLLPGLKVGDQRIEAGSGVATVGFAMTAQPWRETQIRCENGSGKPVAGVEVACAVGGLPWSRLETDAEGRCRVAIPPELGMGLSTESKGAVPVKTYLTGTGDEPASITLPVLPPIQGRVLDPDGRPVPDVAVGRWVEFGPGGGGEMVSFWGGVRAVTDRKGNFVVAPILLLRPSDLANPGRYRAQVLCFADSSFRRIAYRVFNPTRALEPIEVTLDPVRRVRVPLNLGSFASVPGTQSQSVIEIQPHPDQPDLLFYLINRKLVTKGQSKSTGLAKAPVLEESLPAGTYQLKVTLTTEEGVKGLAVGSRKLVIPKGEDPLDLPPLEFELPQSQKLAGKPAPEIDATDLDTGRPVKLADFRGKVVVLDFWGYWCGPCIGSMPDLMDLHRKFKDRPLAIVALHDQSVQSRAQYDRKNAMARQRMWGGSDLPFRVLLDRPNPKKSEDRDPEGTGLTCDRYKISAFPTLFVIDQNGTLVEEVGFYAHDRLESLVRTLVEKAEAR